MSWIINPSGKADGGRGVDWLVELINLFLKVIYCGKYSNMTLENIIKHSTLISILRHVFENAMKNYHILIRTVRHASKRSVLSRLWRKGEHLMLALIAISV